MVFKDTDACFSDLSTFGVLQAADTIFVLEMRVKVEKVIIADNKIAESASFTLHYSKPFRYDSAQSLELLYRIIITVILTCKDRAEALSKAKKRVHACNPLDTPAVRKFTTSEKDTADVQKVLFTQQTKFADMSEIKNELSLLASNHEFCSRTRDKSVLTCGQPVISAVVNAIEAGDTVESQIALVAGSYPIQVAISPNNITRLSSYPNDGWLLVFKQKGKVQWRLVKPKNN